MEHVHVDSWAENEHIQKSEKNMLQKRDDLRKILRYIGLNPGCTGYAIGKHSGVNRLQAMRKIERHMLEKENILKVKSGPRNAKEYTLTFKGVIIALKLEALKPQEVAEKKEYQKQQPLVFGKWTVLGSKQLVDHSLLKLRCAVEYAFSILSHTQDLIPYIEYTGFQSMYGSIDDYVENVGFTRNFYSPFMLLSHEDRDRINQTNLEWLVAVSQDDEIKKFVTNYLKLLCENSILGIRKLKETLRKIEG